VNYYTINFLRSSFISIVSLFMFISILSITILLSNTLYANPIDIVRGVNQITAGPSMVPGPVHAISDEWIPIVMGGDDSSLSTFVLAREYGNGKIIAVGHNGIIVNNEHLDNLYFSFNSLVWLSTPRLGDRSYIMFLQKDDDPYFQGLIGPLEDLLYNNNFSIDTTDTLENFDQYYGSDFILVINDTWKEISQSEIDSVERFVRNGGGLYIAGLGWAWEAYNPNQHDLYPIRKIGHIFGVDWLLPYIEDNENQYLNSPIFYRFYPNILYRLIVNSTGATSVPVTANPTNFAGTTNYIKTNISNSTQIVLTAPAASGGASFSSWTGCDATNQSARTCIVSMNSNRTVTANYGQRQTVLPGFLMLLLDDE
jgi:hypothetical protein